MNQRESNLLNYTENKLEEYISIGMATVSSLKSQKNTLNSTKNRIVEVLNSLGISQSLIKIINSKSNEEKFIFYFGIFFTFLIIYLLWKYF